jgi:hypothetical protein
MIHASGDSAFSDHALAVLALAILWTVMAALAGPVGDFPLNDDWEYGSAAQRLAATGQLHIPGPSVANAVSQIAWGALFCLPFQCSFTVLRFSTLTLGLAGVLALYALVREIGGDARAALTAAATLAVNPLWFVLANTFMTDVPYVAFSIVAIWLLTRGFRRRSQVNLGLGLCVSVAALLDRQLAIVLFAGFAVAYPIRFGRRPASILTAVTPFLFGLLLHFAYHRWMIGTGRAPGLRSSGAAYLLPASLASFAVASVKLTASVAPYLGLFVLPTIINNPERYGRHKLLRAVCGLMAFAAFVTLWHRGRIPALGNVLLPSAFGPLTLRGGESAEGPVITAIWLCATALGAFGIWLFMCRLAFFARSLWLGWRMPSRADDWLLPFLLAILLAYWVLICIVAFNNGFFDRYVIVIIPVALALMCALARPRHATRGLASLALLLLLLCVSVAGTHDYLAWNRARWSAAEFLRHERGVPAAQIDGGYELNERAFYEMQQDRQENVDALHYKDVYQRWFAGAGYLIAFAPIDGYDQILECPYTRWLPPGRSAILVLRKRT